MSTTNTTKNTGNAFTINRDLSKIFIWENRYVSAPYNNSAYGSVTLFAGTVMGRVTATGYIKPTDSTATDGSQLPVGILADDLIALGSSFQNVQICNFGDVAQEQLVFANPTDNLNTTVTFGSGSIRMLDRIHLMGVRLVATTTMTDYDN